VFILFSYSQPIIIIGSSTCMFTSHVCSLFRIRHSVSRYRPDHIPKIIQITKPFTVQFHLSRCCPFLLTYKYSLLHHHLNTLNLSSFLKANKNPILTIIIFNKDDRIVYIWMLTFLDKYRITVNTDESLKELSEFLMMKISTWMFLT